MGLLKLKRKFPEEMEEDCDSLHKTDDTPFVALILYKNSGRFLCMGSIIDNIHILTAKICFERAESTEILVVVGYKKPWWGECSQIRGVKTILRSESGLAILRMKSPIVFSKDVLPAKLPTSVTKYNNFKDTYPGPFQVIGIFTDRFEVPGEPISLDTFYVMKMDTAAAFPDCEANYSRRNLDSLTTFCTIGNASFCWGGWGGPVLEMKENFMIQIGTVILDNCSATTTGPLLSARLDSHADWIRGVAYHGRQPK